MRSKQRFIAPTKSPLYKNGLSVIILSSSPNYRMKSYGPQSLWKDKYGTTILNNQVEIIRMCHQQSEVIFVGGFEIDKIIKNKPLGLRVVENQLYEETNEVEEIRLGLNNALYERVLLLFGDLYFNYDLIKDFQLKKSSLVVDQQKQMLSDDIGVTIVDNKATILSFGVDDAKWCRIAYLQDKELKLLKNFVNDRDNRKLFLYEAINHILDKNGNLDVKYTNNNHEVIHINSTKQLDKLKT